MARTKKKASIDTIVFSREPLTESQGVFILNLLELAKAAVLTPKEFYRTLDRIIPLREETVEASCARTGLPPSRERREIQAAVIWSWGQSLKALVEESRTTRRDVVEKPMGVDYALKLATEEAQRRLEAKRKGERANLDEMLRSRLGDEITDGLFGISQPGVRVADYDPYLYQRKELDVDCPEEQERMEALADGRTDDGPIGPD